MILEVNDYPRDKVSGSTPVYLVFGKRMKLTSKLSIIPSSRDRFRGLVTNTIWLVSCSALDGLIGARLRSTHPGLLRRGAETPTDDQEITEAGQFIFMFDCTFNIPKKRKFIYIHKILLIDTIIFSRHDLEIQQILRSF